MPLPKELLDSNAKLLRGVILIIVFAIVVTVMTNCIIKSVKGDSDVEISTDSKGLTLKIKGSKKNNRTISQFLIPSHEPFFDTGIDLEPNDSCSVTVSGSVNVMFSAKIGDMANYRMDSSFWCDADGIDPSLLEGITDSRNITRNKLQKDLKIAPNLNSGCVIAIFCDDASNGFKEYFRRKRNTVMPILIGKENQSLKNTSLRKQRLILAVNDILLDFSGPKMRESMTWCNNNKVDVSKPKYELFNYQDNVGDFLVTIEKKKE